MDGRTPAIVCPSKTRRAPMSRKTKQKVNELVKARAEFAGIGTRKAKLALNKLAKTEFYAHAKEQPTVDLHCGHVLEVLETIPSESVTCCQKQYKPFYSVQPFETVPWELLDQLI